MATAQRDGLSHVKLHSNRQTFRPPNSLEWYFHVSQSNDESPVEFYRTLKAFIDANQLDLSKSTSLLQLLDKSQKLQQAPLGHFRVLVASFFWNILERLNNLGTSACLFI